MNKPKHSFFCENIDKLVLSEEESNHAVRVLRLKENDSIRIIDGKGRETVAEIRRADKRNLEFNILETNQQEGPKVSIHIAIAPTKNIDRFSFFLEKVTEIGVSQITPIICMNSERKQLKTDKLRKNLIAALKQSGNLFLPEINEPVEFDDFVDQDFDDYSAFIAHCDEDHRKKELKEQYLPGKNVVILIGPEGDFTSEEIILAKEKGFLPAGLGDSRLRTETAGIVACHTIHVLL